MRNAGTIDDSQLEKTIHEIIQSKAQSKIYLFLLRKHHSKTEDIIKGTRLHPSTVREALVRMYKKQLILREKIKNDSIGKNPYVYAPLPPILLIKKHIEELEQRLNTIVNVSLGNKQDSSAHNIQINITKKEGIQ